MTAELLNKIRNDTRKRSPLIHSITNPISINQCANACLAIGARPIMAEHPKEAQQITSCADALVLNLGNITDVRKKSMMIAAQTAKNKKIPVIVDAVGVACSSFRRRFALKLIKKSTPFAIKGNYSEINALYSSAYRSAGVDSDSALKKEEIAEAALWLSKKYNVVILASGKTDIIADGRRIIYIKNGTPQLASVTGTGCMLGVLCGCCASVSQSIEAIATACTVLGICGELSESDDGSGSFMVKLMDNLSQLNDYDVERMLKMEEMIIERT